MFLRSSRSKLKLAEMLSSSTPPAYDLSFDAQGVQNSSEPLPRYSLHPLSGCSTVHTQFDVKEFTYREGMLDFSVYGDALLSDQIPTFMEEGKISGVVRIDSQKGQEVRGITIWARGRIITGSGNNKARDVFTFLNLPTHIWTKQMGQLPTPPVDGFDCELPFSISLPREVTLLDPGLRSGVNIFRLPNSFMEPRSPVRIVYDLVVRIKRNRWRNGFRVITNFAYLQGVRPCSIPPSRAINDETYGWKSLRPVVIKGKLFHEREIEVQCTLSLATPICYNLGSSIHLFLVMRSLDAQGLDVLSKSDCIDVHLERRVRFRNLQMHAAKSIRWISVTDQLGLASWKPSRRSQEPGRRFMRGEIVLDESLSPSISIMNVAVEYEVKMYTFRGTGFQPQKGGSGALLSEYVEITTNLVTCPY
ncbi:hypothetical protein L218DRAFT_654086 [Marasmius fiardii PR-910]|nr:hypothetical protein L218DRAFT_654086 [Marasmius fiardii PR-910]